MMPPTISNKSPHRVAVRKALAPVTAKASVPNFFSCSKAQGRAASEACFCDSSERAGKGGILSLAVLIRNLDLRKDSVMIKSPAVTTGETPRLTVSALSPSNTDRLTP